MPQPTAISLSKFTASVQAAVKAAVKRNPKFKLDPPKGVAVSYLIRGIPVPEAILANVTMAETQSFANDIASQLGAANPEAFGLSAAKGPSLEGAVMSIGRYTIVGIPPLVQTSIIER